MTGLGLTETISIHAPVKGATHILIVDHRHRVISIHAPVKGATQTLIPVGQAAGHFNPRSREGSDLLLMGSLYSITQFQSTLP